MQRSRIGTGIVLAATMVLTLTGTSLALEEVMSAPAALEDTKTCPDGIDGWTKVDGTSDDFPVASYALSFSGVQRGTAYENDPTKGLVRVSLESGWAADLCVKGGVTVVFAYGLLNEQNSTDLVLGGSGNPADISHFSYRLIPPKVVDQWCSPGFWRNNYGAWPTPFSPGTVDSLTNVSFGTILSTPKVYAKTGDFERIADVLSNAHPGISFNGKREADSCPLAADEASK